MGMKNFDGNVDSEYLKESAKFLINIKKESYKMMNIKKGDSVLDIGCGPGIDVFQFSKIVGTKGKAVGFDNDPVMIKEAQKEKNYNNTEFILGDVLKMPFNNNTFDSIRAERLFQVLSGEYNMDAVFKEMLRITKTKGKIVLTDTDWGSASVNFSDNKLTDKLLSFFASDCRPNGYAGRQLFSLLVKHKIKNINIKIFPVITYDFTLTPFYNWLTDEALKNEAANENEIKKWKDELLEKTKKGEFFTTVNMTVAGGEK